MIFIVRNQAKIPNKYIRFSKWKIRKLSKKFGELLYSEIYIKKTSSNPAVYQTTVKLGVPGPDIVISAKSDSLPKLWSELMLKLKRQMRKYNSKQSWA